MKKILTATAVIILTLGLSTVGFVPGAVAASATPAPTQPAPLAGDCVKDVTYAYTYVPGAPSGTITATATSPANTAVKLCWPLYVRSASWTYDLPTSGDSPSYKQTLEKALDATVLNLGTTTYQVPSEPAGCRQHDVYASFVSMAALTLPTTLAKKGDPLEPPFLSTTLRNSGPDKTYTFDTSVGCTVVSPVTTTIIGTCVFDSSRNASFRSVKLVYNNTASNVGVDFIVDDEALNRLVPAGHSVTVEFPDAPVTGKSWVVSAGNQTVTLTLAPFAPCPVTPPTVTPPTVTPPTVTPPTVTPPTVTPPTIVKISADPSTTNQTCRSSLSSTPTLVSGFITVAPTTGLVYSIRPVLPAGAELTNVGTRTDVGPGSYLVTATALDGYTIDGSATWSQTTVMAATNCVSMATFTSDDPSARVLAATGSRNVSALLWIAGILTLLGAGAVITAAGGRRKRV